MPNKTNVTYQLDGGEQREFIVRADQDAIRNTISFTKVGMATNTKYWIGFSDKDIDQRGSNNFPKRSRNPVTTKDGKIDDGKLLPFSSSYSDPNTITKLNDSDILVLLDKLPKYVYILDDSNPNSPTLIKKEYNANGNGEVEILVDSTGKLEIGTDRWMMYF